MRRKGYKCYNPQTKQVWVSRVVIFDELASWYSPLSSTTDDSIPIAQDEATEVELTVEEEEIDTLEESSISFPLSGPNEELDRDDQPIDMSVRTRTQSCNPNDEI